MVGFWRLVQPLQRVPRLACSVASLSRYPGHQLLRSCSLHCKTFTGYLLGKELPAAYTMTHSMQHCIPAPKVTMNPKVYKYPCHTDFFWHCRRKLSQPRLRKHEKTPRTAQYNSNHTHRHNTQWQSKSVLLTTNMMGAGKGRMKNNLKNKTSRDPPPEAPRSLRAAGSKSFATEGI